MMTYRWLRKRLPHRVSVVLTVLLLLLLVLLSIYFGFEPQAEFRYQEI